MNTLRQRLPGYRNDPPRDLPHRAAAYLDTLLFEAYAPYWDHTPWTCAYWRAHYLERAPGPGSHRCAHDLQPRRYPVPVRDDFYLDATEIETCVQLAPLGKPLHLSVGREAPTEAIYEFYGGICPDCAAIWWKVDITIDPTYFVPRFITTAPRPAHVPPRWCILNSAIKLDGDLTWTGEPVRGLYYTAVNPQAAHALSCFRAAAHYRAVRVVYADPDEVLHDAKADLVARYGPRAVGYGEDPTHRAAILRDYLARLNGTAAH
jgi:hypothetical protein